MRDARSAIALDNKCPVAPMHWNNARFQLLSLIYAKFKTVENSVLQITRSDI